MNRAFWIIAVPAALVAAAYIGVGWGYTVPRSVGIAVGALAIVAAAIGVVVRKREQKRGEEETTDGHG